MMRRYGQATGLNAFTEGAMTGYGFVDGAIRDRATDEQTRKDREHTAYERERGRKNDADLDEIFKGYGTDQPGLVVDPGVGPAPVTSQSVAAMPPGLSIAGSAQPGLKFETVENRGSMPAGAMGLSHAQPTAGGGVVPAGDVSRPAVMPEGGGQQSAASATAGLSKLPGRMELLQGQLRQYEALYQKSARVGGRTGFEMMQKLHPMIEDARGKLHGAALDTAESRVRMGDYSSVPALYRLIDDGGTIHGVEPTMVKDKTGALVPGARLRISGRDGNPVEREMTQDGLLGMLRGAFDPAAVRKAEMAQALKRAEKAAESKTLSPGERLVNGAGQELARAPDRPLTVGMEQSVLVPDGTGGYRTVRQGTLKPSDSVIKMGPDDRLATLDGTGGGFSAPPAPPPKGQYDPKRGVVVDERTGTARPVVDSSTGKTIGPEERPISEGALKQISGVRNVVSALNDYKAVLSKWSIADAANPDRRAAMGVVYKNALLQAKEAYNLGVINGPDYEILQSVLTDPAGWKGAITSNAAMAKQADELQRIMTKVADTVAQVHGRAAAPGAPPAPAAPKTITVAGQQLEVRTRADGKQFVQRGGKWFEVQQ